MSGKLPVSNFSDTTLFFLFILALLFGGCQGAQGVQGVLGGISYKLITKNNNYANNNNK